MCMYVYIFEDGVIFSYVQIAQSSYTAAHQQLSICLWFTFADPGDDFFYEIPMVTYFQEVIHFEFS